MKRQPIVRVILVGALALCLGCEPEQASPLSPGAIDVDVDRGMNADAYERERRFPVEAEDDR